MSGPTFVVLGSGMQGTCAAYDFARFGAGEVRIADADAKAAARAAARVTALVPGAHVTAHAADARDPASLARVLKGADALLSCVPYFLNPGIAAACVDSGVHYADLGGNTEVSGRVLAMDTAARAKGVSLVPDCGLAPGLGNTLAADALARVPGARTVHVYCGGLPQRPEKPFDYHLVFALEGLINEYDGYAESLRGGEKVRVRTLDDAAPVHFPGLGEMEAFSTSGGTSTAPDTFAGQVDTYEYRTLRYPGHIAMFRAYRDAGLFDEAPIVVNEGATRGVTVRPRDVLSALLRPRLVRPGAKDLIALMVEARGPAGAGRWIMVDRHDDATGFTAMERSTAFPAAVVSWMQVAGETGKGGVRLEAGVPAARFLEHLERRGLPLRWEVLS